MTDYIHYQTHDKEQHHRAEQYVAVADRIYAKSRKYLYSAILASSVSVKETDVTSVGKK